MRAYEECEGGDSEVSGCQLFVVFALRHTDGSSTVLGPNGMNCIVFFYLYELYFFEYEFLEKYSEIFGEKNCSVVVMLTSSDQQNDKDKSMAHKAVVDYFTKPLSVEAVVTLCEENKNICE